MKLKCDFFFYFFLSIFSINCISTENENDLEKDSGSQNPILMRGWLRYFVYNPNLDSTFKPNTFYVNQQYFHQFDNKHQLNMLNTNIRDEYGYVHIPSKFHFFFVLSSNTIYVISARKNDVAETVQSIEMGWILPTQWKNGNFSGGIEDLGSFREGFCFRLNLKTSIIWNLCSDNNHEKNEWISKIFSLLPNSENDPLNSNQGGNSCANKTDSATDIPLPFNITIVTTNDNLNNLTKAKNKSDSEESDIKNDMDGKWVIIQDWSQCSMACNGGKQFLQRVCIPPKSGGDQCEGEPVLERHCNTFPCPNVIKREVKLKTTRNPIIRVQRLSNRFLRYEVCIVKEGELDLLIENPTLTIQPKIPVRVILNNKTLTIFGIPNYNSVYKSFDLEYISLKKHPNPKEEKSCMIVLDIRDISKRATLCIMPISIKGDQSVKEMRNKWVYDIRFFKEKCQDKNPREAEVMSDDDPYIIRRKNEILMQKREEALEKIHEKDEQKKEVTLQKHVKNAAKIALQAVEKELNYEQLVLKEEMLKETKDQKDIQKQIQIEKAKQDSVQNELVQKARPRKTDSQNKVFEEKIKEIQSQAIIQVQQARAKTEEKLDQMKRVAERKKREGKREITTIRNKIATTLLNEGRVGNITLCNPQQSEEEKKGYCDKNMKDDAQKLDDCKNNDSDFCYTCCDNEFGKIYENLRDKCYLKCDDFANNKFTDWNEGNEIFFEYTQNNSNS